MELKRTWLDTRRAWLPLLAYPLLFALASLAAMPFWHLHTGIRCAALWTLPMRHWGWLALGEILAALLLAPHVTGWPQDTTQWLDLLLPFPLFAGAHALVFLFVKPGAPIAHLRELVMRMFAAIVAVALASFAFVNLRHLWDGSGPRAFALALLEHRLGSWLGMMTVGMLIVTFANRKMHASPDFNLHRVGFAILPAALMLAALNVSGQPSPLLPLLMAIAPLMLVALHNGARVAIVGFNALAGLVWLNLSGLPADWLYGRIEILLVLTGFAAIGIGGASDLYRHRQTAKVQSAVAENERSTRMNDVALRLTQHDEKERQRIAQDLHDQLGQDLTAIATYVQIASKRTNDVGTLQYLKTVSTLVDEAHWHLRDINDKLHPIALSRFGLARALESGPVIELLTEQGFEYEFTSDNVDRNLPDKIEIALYRICQEAITNAIKHGKHRWLSISLVQRTTTQGRAVLELLIHDDEGQINVGNSTGYGLQGIRDRAHSVGAWCEFNAESGTPRYLLEVEFEPLETQA